MVCINFNGRNFSDVKKRFYNKKLESYIEILFVDCS